MAPGAPGAVATIDGPTLEQLPPEGRSRRRYDPAWDDWKRPRRWPGILLSCAIVLGFISVVVWHYRPVATHVAHRIVPSKIAAKGAFVVGNAGPGTAVTTFSGKANASGLAFSTTGNLVILHSQCKCQTNFVVTVSDLLNPVVALPVSTLGSFSSSVALPIHAGHYTLSVVGTGPWTLQVIQPTPALPAVATPFVYFSSGQSVLGPFSAANRFLGLSFFSFTNGSISVAMLNLQGATTKTVFLARSPAQPSVLLPPTLAPNPFYLEVTAAGYWELTVQRSSTG